MHEKIIILDFGSQTTQLISKTGNVAFAIVLPLSITVAKITNKFCKWFAKRNYAGIQVVSLVIQPCHKATKNIKNMAIWYLFGAIV